MLSFVYGLGVLCGLALLGWLAHRFVVRPDAPPETALAGAGANVANRTALDEAPVVRSSPLIAPAPRIVPAPSAPAPVVDVPRILGPGELAVTLDQAVHLLIVGETNSGKSVAANALLALRARTDRICVIDPHATPEDWGGLSAIGMGRDYPAIDAACAALREEMSDRYDRRARGDTTYEPLTVFVDELPAIMQNCKEARPFFGELLREARKVGMRLVCLTQSTRVKTLGIEGEGDVLENLAWLLLGEKALTACPASRDLERPAALDARGRVIPAQTTAFPMLAARRVSADRLWEVSTVSEPRTADPIKETKITDDDLARLFDFLDTPAERETDAEIGAENPKPFQQRETAVSPVATAKNEADTPLRNEAFLFVARLIRAKKVTETEALKICCGVKPGESKEYQQARAELKRALEIIDSEVA